MANYKMGTQGDSVYNFTIGKGIGNICEVRICIDCPVNKKEREEKRKEFIKLLNEKKLESYLKNPNDANLHFDFEFKLDNTVNKDIKALKLLFKPKEKKNYHNFCKPDVVCKNEIEEIIEMLNSHEISDDMSDWRIYDFDDYAQTFGDLKKYIEMCNFFNCISEKTEKITSLTKIKEAIDGYHTYVKQTFEKFKETHPEEKEKIAKLEKQIEATDGTGSLKFKNSIDALMEKRTIRLAQALPAVKA